MTAPPRSTARTTLRRRDAPPRAGRVRLVSSAVVLAAAGCAAAPATPVPGLPAATPIVRASLEPTIPIVPSEPTAVASVVVVRPEALTPTGVAIEPASGRRLVLAHEGLVTDLATGEVVWAAAAAAPGPFGYTDLVALSVDQLAVTAMGDGLLVDLRTAEAAPHFCYEPEGWEELPNEPVQISAALTLDRAAGLFYAQPRTIEDGGAGAVTGSFVASYDAGTGADLSWWALPDPTFLATGMAALPRAAPSGARLVLASGTTLYAFDPASATLAPAADLASLGVLSVAGLAHDARAGTLLVLDDARRLVVELRLSALGLD